MSTIFTKIINGEIPGRIVYKDEDVAAFLDIDPVTYGHTLVVPIKEVDKWTDLEPELLTKLMSVAQRIGKAQIDIFDAPRAGLQIVGFDVPHAHIHVFPAHSIQDFTASVDNPDPERMDEAARALRAALEKSN